MRFKNRPDCFRPTWRFPKIYDLFRGGPWVRYGNNPVLESGVEADWNDWGIRDPRLMVNIYGNLVIEASGHYYMYYSGYKYSTPHYHRAIGAAYSYPGTSNTGWLHNPANPILYSGSSGAWDDFGVQCPSVIKFDNGDYRMWYSGVNSDWSSWGIGLATASYPLSWTKHPSNPLLTDSDFSLGGNNILTFPSVIKRMDSLTDQKCYMLLGGTYSNAGGKDLFKIFAAESNDDGYTWTPLNSGNPVISYDYNEFRYNEFDSIEGATLIKVDTNKYMALFHWNYEAAAEKHYIGIAISSDMVNWSKYQELPIFVPGNAGSWDAHRVEVAFIPREDLGTNTLRMWYSGAPTSDGEKDSAIGYATSDQKTY